jgi:hypothetical protein
MPSSEDGTRKSADKSCWKYTFTGYDLLFVKIPHVRYPTPQNQSTEHPFCFVGNKMEKDTMLYNTIPAKYILKGNE